MLAISAKYVRLARLPKKAAYISMNRRFLRPAIFLLAISLGVPPSQFSSASQPDVLLTSMQRELQRATAALAKASPAPYYISYTAADINATVIFGISGSIAVSNNVQRRQADVIMRVGSPALDNTHSKSRASGIMSSTLPLSDNPDAIGRVLWQLTDREYEQASAAFQGKNEYRCAVRRGRQVPGF